MDNDYPNYPNPVRLSFLEGISMENSSYMTEKYKKNHSDTRLQVLIDYRIILFFLYIHFIILLITINQHCFLFVISLSHHNVIYIYKGFSNRVDSNSEVLL